MAEAIKEVEIVIKAKDQTQDGVASAKAGIESVGASAATAAPETEKVFGQQAQVSIGKFSSKAGAAAMIMGQLGGSMGQAGAIGMRVVGVFGSLSLALGPLGVALAAVTTIAAGMKYAFDTFVAGPADEAKKKIDDLITSTNDYIAANDKMMQADAARLMGLSSYDMAALEGRKRVQATTDKIVELEAELAEERASFLGPDKLRVIQIENDIKRLTITRDSINAEIKMLKTTGIGAGIAGAKPPAAPSGGAKRAGPSVSMGWSVAGDVDLDAIEAQNAAQDAKARALGSSLKKQLQQEQEYEQARNEGTRAALDAYLRMREEAADQGQEILEREIEFERQCEAERMDMLHNRLSAMEGFIGQSAAFANDIIKNEKAKFQVAQFFQALTDGMKAAHEQAEAVAAFATYRYYEGAMHQAAAVLYMASASVAGVRGATGRGYTGGTGGGAPSAGERSSYSAGSSDREEKQSVTVIIEGSVFSGSNAGKEIQSMLDQFSNSTNPGRTRSSVEL